MSKIAIAYLALWAQHITADPERAAKELETYALAYAELLRLEDDQPKAKASALKRAATKVEPQEPEQFPAPEAPQTERQATAMRKREILDRLTALRARGTTVADIANATNGITVNDVINALQRSPMTKSKWEALERAVNRLEEHHEPQND